MISVFAWLAVAWFPLPAERLGRRYVTLAAEQGKPYSRRNTTANGVVGGLQQRLAAAWPLSLPGPDLPHVVRWTGPIGNDFVHVVVECDVAEQFPVAIELQGQVVCCQAGL